MRSSATLALPVTHVDIGMSPLLSVCFSACSGPNPLLPAPAKCCDVQLHVAKSAHAEETHAENKQLVLRYVCSSSVELGDTGAKDIAAMVHAQISGFPSIPGQSHRPLSTDQTPYLAQDRSYIPGSPLSCLP